MNVDDPVTDNAPMDDAEQPAEPVVPVVPAVEPEPAQLQLHLRRAPKYGAFGITGLVVGVVVGLLLAFRYPATGDYSARTIAGYFAASFGMIGVVLGLGVAVIADRRARAKFAAPRRPRRKRDKA